MANYPQLDNASGVWNIKEVYEAVMGGYWPVAGARGIFAAGGAPGNVDTIDFITMASTGDAADFGNLSAAKSNMGSAGSFNRALFGGGKTPTEINVIDYVEFNSTGNAADFGDLTDTNNGIQGTGNSRRSIFGG